MIAMEKRMHKTAIASKRVHHPVQRNLAILDLCLPAILVNAKMAFKPVLPPKHGTSVPVKFFPPLRSAMAKIMTAEDNFDNHYGIRDFAVLLNRQRGPAAPWGAVLRGYPGRHGAGWPPCAASLKGWLRLAAAGTPLCLRVDGSSHI